MDQSTEQSVFITCGTHEDAFERLRGVVVSIAEAGIPAIFQHGHTKAVTHPLVQNYQWLDSERMSTLFKNCKACICHAGTGTIITCLRHGKRPIVIPRCVELNEHVDNHQFEIANAFSQMNRIQIIKPGEESSIVSLLSNEDWNQPVLSKEQSSIYTIVESLALKYSQKRYD